MTKKITYRFVACVSLICLCLSALAQVNSIGGIVNQYSKVTDINRATRTVTLVNASMFKPEELPDTVLLVQMTGISEEGNMDNVGLYEFHIVTHVSGSTVVLQSVPDKFINGTQNELVQMVRVPSYKNAKIDSKLTCKEWNWAEGNGGILALMVEGTLKFNADIDVSGLGFKGGGPSENITVTCVPPSSTLPNYSSTESHLAGNKGEGAITTSFFNPGTSIQNTRGYLPTWNGGGGGNGQWSGGGGGANGNNGGNGDNQACSTTNDPVGGFPATATNAGFPIKYDEPNSFNPSEHILMGGGGGAGTGLGTAGGNGGGIVIIIAKKLDFSPNTFIKANGGSVVETVINAGAGGGGAGGSILLSVEDYGDIHAEIMGGNGGSVNRGNCNNTANSIGVGGGGSGGFMLVTGNLAQHNNWRTNAEQLKLNGGNYGGNNISGTPCVYAANGRSGLILGDFKVQLKGFLRNHIITTSDTLVCHNEMVTVTASQPISNTEKFDDYYWELSDGSDWEKITDTNTYGLTFLKYQFTEDSYVRRIVKSGEVADTSMHIKILVRDAITGNHIDPNTTICWSEEKFMIGGNVLIEGGGGGPYTFEWEESHDNGVTWRKVNNASDNMLFVSLVKSGGIQAYRRIVVSELRCVSASNASVITIQPQINNEIIPSDRQVCATIAELNLPQLTGGDGKNYDCLWEISTDNQNWNEISRQQNYQPNLEQRDYGEYFYRRTVVSGECSSTSVVKIRFNRQPASSEFVIKTNDKPGNVVLTFQFTANLDVQQPPDAGSGTWSSKKEGVRFLLPNQPKTTVNNLQLGVDTITWTTRNGACQVVSKSVFMEVKDVKIYTGFSPNGDDINECFRIVGSDNALSSELVILDRYNKVVFESKSFNKGSSNQTDCLWDGRSSSGNELPSGTYFYRLTLMGENDKTYMYKGYVVLKK